MRRFGSTVSTSIAAAALVSLAFACSAPTSAHQQNDPDETPPEDDGQAMLIPSPEEASTPPGGLSIANPSRGLT